MSKSNNRVILLLVAFATTLSAVWYFIERQRESDNGFDTDYHNLHDDWNNLNKDLHNARKKLNTHS